jgi:hypothetical protein
MVKMQEEAEVLSLVQAGACRMSNESGLLHNLRWVAIMMMLVLTSMEAAAPHLICTVSVLQLDSSLRVQTFLTLPIACREAWNTKQNLVQRKSHGFQAGQNFHNPYDPRHFNHQLEAGSHHLGSKLGEYSLQMSEIAATTISSSLTVLPVSLFPHTVPVQRATHHHLG